MTVKKNPKTGKWYCKFYYKDMYGVNRQKKKEGFRTKSEAEAYVAEFKNKTSGSVTMTFASLAEEYLKECKVKLKPTTYYNKECMVKRKFLPFFGDMPLNEITKRHVKEWQLKMMDPENGYSATYLRHLHSQMNAIFNYAIHNYDLPKNPSREAGAMGKKKANRCKIWQKEDFEKFIEAVSDNEMSKVMFTVLFYSGLREGELLCLTLNDCDFKNNVINVDKSYARLHRNDLIMLPKTEKSTRKVYMPESVMNMIQEYSKTLYDYKPKQRLFPVYKKDLLDEMKRGCEISGVEKIHIHDIRHSHASLLLQMGVTMLEISERLGHEDVKTTLETYTHLYPNSHSDTAKKLEKLM